MRRDDSKVFLPFNVVIEINVDDKKGRERLKVVQGDIEGIVGIEHDIKNKYR